MAPRSEGFKRIRQRLRRSLRYGDSRMDCLTIQLSELVVNYFDRSSSSNQFLDLDFAAQVSYDSCLDPCTLVAAMIYIERLRCKNPVAFAQSNPNDLYLSALMVATKFLNDCGLDEFIWNDEWAEIAKTNMRRVNQLELRLLDNLDWDITISSEQFDSAIEAMERGVALSSAKTTGFLSYTDINTLATDLRPYMEHVRRFIVMSLTVASAYLVLCTLSWSLLLGVHKTVEIVQDDIAVMESNVDSNAIIFDLAQNATEKDECFNANETLKFDLWNQVLLLKDAKLPKSHQQLDFIKPTTNLKPINCHSISMHRHTSLQASTHTIVV